MTEGDAWRRQPSPSRRVVAVLGPPRSGTSAMAAALECLGVDMGDSRLHRPADQSNEKGFWEDQRIIDLCARLLASRGLRWDSLAFVGAAEWLAPQRAVLVARAAGLVGQSVSSARGGIWGCKNPVMARTLPAWAEAFRLADCRASYLVTLRNPLSFAASVTRGSPHFSQGDSPTHLYLTWLVYMLGALEPALAGERVVLVDYDNLMAHPRPQLERISRSLGLPITAQTAPAVASFCANFMEKGLRHATFDKKEVEADRKVPALVGRAFRVLSTAADDRIELGSSGFQSQWHEIAGAAKGSAAVFELIDQMESQLMKSRALGRFVYRHAPQTVRRWLARFA